LTFRYLACVALTESDWSLAASAAVTKWQEQQHHRPRLVTEYWCLMSPHRCQLTVSSNPR